MSTGESKIIKPVMIIKLFGVSILSRARSTFETGSLINLSVRAKQRVRIFPKLWDMYARPYQEKPKEEAPRPRLVPQITRPTSTPTTKGAEQEKKLKGYFPWLKV